MMPGSIPSLASVGPPPKQTGKAAKGKKKQGGNNPLSGLSDPRPYNHYNLYFILERELFLQGRGVFPSANAGVGNATDVDYSGLVVPSLPPRYADVVLTPDWYVHRRKKRAHVKTHGILSFREMAAMVASRWKDEDKEIVEFVKTVADRVKRRYDDYKLLPLQAAVMRCRGVGSGEGPVAGQARFTSSSVMQSSVMRGGPMSSMMNNQGRQGPLSPSSPMGPSSPMNNLMSSPVQSARQAVQVNQAMGSMSLPFQRTPQHQQRSPQGRQMPFQRSPQRQVQPMNCSSSSSSHAQPCMGPDMMCRDISISRGSSDAIVSEMVNEMMMCGAATGQGSSMMSTSSQCPTSSQGMLGRGDSRGSQGSSSSGASASNANIASVDMGDDEIFAMWCGSNEQVSTEDFFF